MYRQHPPNSIQVEATEGCNLRCVFCGLNGIRGENVRTTDRFMKLETAIRLARSIKEAGWKSRIEFAMHGEPTLNPLLPMFFTVFRTYLPQHQLMLTTNGVPLQKHPQGFINATRALFDAGLNVLALDDYRGLKVAPFARDFGKLEGIPVYEYPDEREGNPHVRRKPGTRIITIIRDISIAKDGTHARLSNHTGAAAPLNDRGAGKRCTMPFRELSVRWDGNVAICCDDWRGIYKVGNVNQLSVEQIWHSSEMYAARKKLLRGERTFGPCKGCDNISTRPGLLPDYNGKETYPEADECDDAVIERACSGAPYTVPVLRPWEMKR